MTTTKSTPKIAARRKVAAAVLALGAGVLGTGFAAGVIDLGVGGQTGFGAGVAENVNTGTDMVDITGQLTITRPMTANFNNEADNPFSATQSDKYTISGFDQLANAEGATYHIAGRQKDGATWSELATGTVPADGVVQVPVEKGYTTYGQIAVSLEK